MSRKYSLYTSKSTGECIEKCRYSELVEGDCNISNILGAKDDFLTIIKNEIITLGDDILKKMMKVELINLLLYMEII